MIDNFLRKTQQSKMKELWDNKKDSYWDKIPKGIIIGITGPIGSGKTTIAKIFSKHHFDRIDADKIAHRILNKNKIVYKKLINEFGDGILNKNRFIGRKKLGDIVFNDSKKVKKLNSIMHPIIIREIKNQIKKIKAKCGNDAKIIIDAPLLFEAKTEGSVDKIVVVKASKKNILKRNKNFSKEQIEKILKYQMPMHQKQKYADYAIDNNGNLKNLEKQITNIIQKLK